MMGRALWAPAILALMLATAAGIYGISVASNPQRDATKNIVDIQNVDTIAASSSEESIATSTGQSVATPTPATTIQPAKKPTVSPKVEPSSSDVSEVKPSLEQITKQLEQVAESISDYRGKLVPADDVQEKTIDLKAVVLVRCVYKSQYFAQSQQPYDEVTFELGSGVFVSQDGSILTAAHVVREKTLGTDITGRTWNFDHCEIARTTNYDSSIDANPPRYTDNDPLFEKVDILHEPSEEAYRSSTGYDVVVLRLKNPSNESHYIKLYPDLIELPQDTYSGILIGYPGKYANINQTLERFDGVAHGLVSFEKSTCESERFSVSCGWRYFFWRYWMDLEKYYGYYTDYGLESSTA